MNQGSLTTHVLDTARGRPAAGVRVTVEARAGDGWTPVEVKRKAASGRVHVDVGLWGGAVPGNLDSLAALPRLLAAALGG